MRGILVGHSVLLTFKLKSLCHYEMLACIEKLVQLYLAVAKCDITNDTMRDIKYSEDAIELEGYWLSTFIFEFSFVRF